MINWKVVKNVEMSSYCKNILFCILLYTCLLLPQSLEALTGKHVYTPQEEAALKTLYSLVKDELYFDYQKENSYLIYWLRNKNLDVNKAKDALISSLNYKKMHDIANVLEDEEMKELTKILPVSLGESISKEGSPAYILSASTFDIRKAMIRRNGKGLRRFIFYGFEYMLKLARKLGTTKLVYVVDLNGFNFKQHFCLSCVTYYVDLVSVYENQYPDMVEQMIGINTPKIFASALEMMKPLMSPRTRRIYKSFGHNKAEWQKMLLEIFDAKQLTSQFGGTKGIKG